MLGEQTDMTHAPPPIIDSHAHLYFPELRQQAVELLVRAAEAGVAAIVNIGTEPGTNGDVLAQTITLPRKFRDAMAGRGESRPRPPLVCPQLVASLGFHPHEARTILPGHWDELRRMAAEPQVVALGEFGLDFHYDHSPRDAQRAVLRQGIELALELDLPMVIHSREADLGVVEALDEVAGRDHMPRGVFHCFTDPWSVAEAALERGFMIGLTGIATYKNAEQVRDVARRTPLERTLIETDAPFCTPDPLRTERRKQRKKGSDEPNEPAFVGMVADRLAELHGTTPDAVRRTTSANARALFGL